MVNEALLERLAQVAPFVLGGSQPVSDRSPGLAGRLAGHLAHRPSDASLWLAIVAFTTVFPTVDEHRAVRRSLALARPGAELSTLLAALRPLTARAPDLSAPMEFVADATVLDANFTGRFDHNTGVQRVLRETASRWVPERPVTLVCWNDAGTAMRRLVGQEIARVVDWAGHSGLSAAERREVDAAQKGLHDIRRTVVVPVRSVIVEIEVAQAETAPALAALAAVSGNRLGIVGHDTIPIVSAQSQDAGEIERYARFLTVVKNADRVAGVSASAAEEFRGFTRALSAQNVTGPTVVAVPLATNPPSAAARSAALAPAGDSGLPLVLIVGSQEPRKNHDAILFAARQLWADGVRFHVRFIGGGTAASLSRFDADIAAARAGGLPVEALRGASDSVLLDSYRQARFTVFPSLHEGFGLPVAESLALGTPVITANHGSLLEVAEGGGCLVVDAYDDEAVRLALKQLLTDEAAYEKLRSEARSRSFRTWQQYADELWAELVEPLRARVDAGDYASGATTAGSTAALFEESKAAGDAGLDAWWRSVVDEARAARARENSPLRAVTKIVPLGRFFVARSREMGVAAASKAAWRVVRRRLVRG